MKKIFYLIALMCISQLSYSQSDFRKGFIVNQDQDTTHGLIKYKEGNTSYRSCEFKETNSQNTIIYKPGDIIGYGYLNDKYFQSKKIESSEQNSELVLLEVLVGGKVTLYKFENIFYLEKAEQGLLKLTNKVESIIDGERVTSQSKSYLGVLNLYLSDSPAMSQAKIFGTTFNEKSLTDLVAAYNKSMNSSTFIYKLNKPWVHARFGLSGGLINSLIVLESSNDVFDHLGPFKKYNSPIAGATFEILSPRINEKLSFRTDFLFSKSKYDSYNFNTLGGKTTKNYVTIEMTHLKVPIGLKYTFNGKNLSTFINAGLSETITINSKSLWKQTVEYITLFHTYEEDALEIGKSQVGIWGGAGISTSVGKSMNIYLELRYERTDGINGIDYIAITKANVSNIMFTIGIASK
jgi:hypothetical protein